MSGRVRLRKIEGNVKRIIKRERERERERGREKERGIYII